MAVERMNTAASLQLRQALCVLFARLLNEDLQATLGFLEQHQVEGGGHGGDGRAISVVLTHWCKDHMDFAGAYNVKVWVGPSRVWCVCVCGWRVAM